MTTEFYDKLVPKERAANLRFRRRVLELGYENPQYADDLFIMAKRDLLFFVNTFLWLYEPRPKPRVLPFITRPYQDDALLKLDGAFGQQDVGIEKSRDVGGTWCVLALYFHRWVFEPLTTMGLMSRNEAAVDQPDDTDTLMWKLDFLLGAVPQGPGLPYWMKPNYSRSYLKLVNEDTGSRFFGYAATGNAQSGGRKTSVLCDEFAKFPRGADYDALASLQYVTNNRIFLSTYKGPAGAFFDVMQDDSSSLLKITIDWKDDPAKAAGLYTSENGRLKIIDTKYAFPPQYPFVLDGKLRSIYYDAECKRPGATPQSVAEELDHDPGASGSQFFDRQMLETAKRRDVRAPWVRGRLEWDPETFEPRFVRTDDGPLWLWTNLDGHGRPPRNMGYAGGFDIAAGTGGDHSSNSTAVVIDRQTGEQVAEFATNTMIPEKFAGFATALCKWFHNAKMVPEVNGPTGAQFLNALKHTGYQHLYYRNVEMDGETPGTKKTLKIGYFANDKSKPVLLGEFQRAVNAAECIIRSSRAAAECHQFIYKDGKIVHASSRATEDDASKGAAHGDIVIAFACAWEGVKDAPVAKSKKGKEELPLDEVDIEDVPYGSMAWRFKLAEADAAGRKDEWGD